MWMDRAGPLFEWCLIMTWLVHPKSRSWLEKISDIAPSFLLTHSFHSDGMGELPKIAFKVGDDCVAGRSVT